MRTGGVATAPSGEAHFFRVAGPALAALDPRVATAEMPVPSNWAPEKTWRAPSSAIRLAIKCVPRDLGFYEIDNKWILAGQLGIRQSPERWRLAGWCRLSRDRRLDGTQGRTGLVVRLP